MFSRFGHKLDYLLLGIVLPICLSYFTYFGFITAYTAGVFSEKTFLHQYLQGVFRSRVLGRWLLLSLYHLLQPVFQDRLSYRFLHFIDIEGDPTFYLSYFVLNTLFFVMTALLLVAAFTKLPGRLSVSQRRERVLLLLLLITFSQFVVLPYDMLSYALLAATLLISIAYVQKPRATLLSLLTILTILAAATRETALLQVGLFAYILFQNGRLRSSWRSAAILFAAAVLVYIALKLCYGGGSFDSIGFISGYPAKNLLGLITSLSLTLLLTRSEAEWQRLKILFLFAFPYIAGVAIFGMWVEIRLWIPVLISMSLLLPYEPQAEAVEER